MILAIINQNSVAYLIIGVTVLACIRDMVIMDRGSFFSGKIQMDLCTIKTVVIDLCAQIPKFWHPPADSSVGRFAFCGVFIIWYWFYIYIR